MRKHLLIPYEDSHGGEARWIVVLSGTLVLALWRAWRSGRCG
jgi:hypothetical protein